MSGSRWDTGKGETGQIGVAPRPLAWPGGGPPRLTRSQRLWLLFPVVGWIAAAVARGSRRRRDLRRLDQQVLARPFRPQFWGSDRRRQQLARLVCETIADELGWPAPHFIPTDPLEIVFGRPCIGAEVVALFDGIKERFRYDVRTDKEIRTLGELVDRCLEAAPTGSPRNETTSD